MFRVTYRLKTQRHWREAGYVLQPSDAAELIDKNYAPETPITEPGDYIFTDKNGNIMDVNIEVGMY